MSDLIERIVKRMQRGERLIEWEDSVFRRTLKGSAGEGGAGQSGYPPGMSDLGRRDQHE